MNDVFTVEGINKFDGFVNSKAFQDLFENEKTGKFIKEQLDYFANKLRNSELLPSSSNEFKILKDTISGLGTISGRAALSSLTSAVTQTAPIIGNTVINLKNPVNFGKALSLYVQKGTISWINQLEQSISQRGGESRTSLEYADKVLNKYNLESASEIQKALKEITNFYMKQSLLRSDVIIAKASFLAYYLEGLQNQGINTDNIDFNTHKVNKEAARYADEMVTEQQNENISETAARMFSSKSAGLKILRSLVIPFASFTTSQKDKIKTNMSMLFGPSDLATKEDKIKAIKSIASTAVEIAIFNGVKFYAQEYLLDLANNILGIKSTDEEEKLRKRRALEYLGKDLLNGITGAMDFLESDVSALAFNKLLDLGESIYNYYDSDQFKTFETIAKEEDKSEKEYQKKIEKAFGKSEVAKIMKSYDDKKKEKLEEELDKSFRFYIKEESDPQALAIAKAFGGVLGAGANIYYKGFVDNALNYYQGHKNSDGTYTPYTEKEKRLLRIYGTFDALSTIPLIFPREARNVNTYIKKGLDDKYKRQEFEEKEYQKKIEKYK
jgi:hypothetical protein